MSTILTSTLNGKLHAANLREKVTEAVAHIKQEQGIVPGLATVLVGDDPASHVYVRNKVRLTEECGMRSVHHPLPVDTSEHEVLSLIESLNNDASISGILVQLPLPDHIDEFKVINTISVYKDVDGFHCENVGLLSIGKPRFVSCTPLGCQMLLRDRFDGDFSGLNAVVVGRSNIVGKPMASLLLAGNATVTMAHSRTANLPDICRQADILVAAVGRPKMIPGDWIKPGAVVVDVGINRVESQKGYQLVGDVDYESAQHVASVITPVPGGVGPMTIACLLYNTVLAACQQHALDIPQSLQQYS